MPERAKPAAAGRDAALTLVITRIVDAPPDAVFRAWTDPLQIARWIGPRSVKAEVKTMDARPGGAYRIAMHHQSGGVNIVSGVYREIAPPERLVFTWAWEDDSATHRARHETVVTLTFRAIGEKTEMTLRQERFDTTTSRDSHNEGWTGSFDKLAEMLGGSRGRSEPKAG